MEENTCSSCFSATKYECLICNEPFCMLCSVFEEKEDTEGWQMGHRVGYCEPCYAMKRSERDGEPDGVEDEDDDEEEEEEEEEKSPMGKKKAGRKSQWSEEATTDLIDVIINNQKLKEKLIFVNTKNQKNTELYTTVIKEVKERAEKRNEVFLFTVKQVRSKFKRCIAACKTAAMTIKTATGLARFQEEKNYGKWFTMLFPVVKCRDSCKPELALEPSSRENQDDKENTIDDFVPTRSVRQRKRKRSEDNIEEMVEVLKEAVKNDPTKDILEFMRSEMERSRQHEKELMQMLIQSNAGPNMQSMGMYTGLYNNYPTFPQSSFGDSYHQFQQ